MYRERDKLKNFKSENGHLLRTISDPILVQTQRPQRPRLRRAVSSSTTFSTPNLSPRTPLRNLDLPGFRDLQRFGVNSFTVFIGSVEEETAENPEPEPEEPKGAWAWWFKGDDKKVKNDPSIQRQNSAKQIQKKVISRTYERTRNPDRFLSKITAATGRIANKNAPPKKKIRQSLREGQRLLNVPSSESIEDLPYDELDEGWLYYTGSDNSQEEAPDEAEKARRKSFVLGESKSDKFMRAINLYFNVLAWTGRMPYERRKFLNFTRFIGSGPSWNYRIFCVTSIFMTFLAAVMLTNFLIIYNQNPRTIYRKIEALEMDKYWVVGLFTMLNLWHVAITSLYTIFQGAAQKAQFFMRWNVCCNLLDYDTSYRVKFFTKRELWLISTYTIVLIISIVCEICTGKQWNGAFGFISMLILRLWIPQYRLSKHYRWLRIIGAFIHLYSIFAARMTTVLLLLYCQALENAARLFNARLVEALGMAGRVEGDGKIQKIVVQKRIIPYKKLLAEHVAVTTFSRQLGHVFAVRLAVLILIKAFTMLVASYNLLLILDGDYSAKHKFSSTYVEGVGDLDVPITYKISPYSAGVILGILISFSWTTFFHSTECVHSAGNAIMDGLDYVRRHGIILCKSSHERRFIMTMQNSFSPKHDYYITCGFKINRPFICGFLAVLFSYSFMLHGYTLQRIVGEEILVCDDGGKCQKSQMPSSSPKEFQTVAFDKGKGIHGSVEARHNTTVNATTGFGKPAVFSLKKFKDDYMYQCKSIIDGEPIDRLRMIFHQTETNTKVGSDYAITRDLEQRSKWCEARGPPFWDIVLTVDDEKLKEFKYGNDVNWHKLCFYSEKARDDCENPEYRLPDMNGALIQPKLELVKITLKSVDELSRKQIEEGKWTYYYCCFEWDGYRSMCGLARTQDAQGSMEAQAKYVKERCKVPSRDRNFKCKHQLEDVTDRCHRYKPPLHPAIDTDLLL